MNVDPDFTLFHTLYMLLKKLSFLPIYLFQDYDNILGMNKLIDSLKSKGNSIVTKRRTYVKNEYNNK